MEVLRMAKQLTIKELLNMDITDLNKMHEKELRKMVGRLRDAGNKKIKRLQKTGLSTPALRQVERSGGLFSTKDKNLNQLRAEYQRIKAFVSAKTSTASGYKKAQAETRKEFEKKGIKVSQDKLDKMFKVYEKLRKDDPSISVSQLKYGVLKELSMMNDDFDPEKAILLMQERLDDIYEEQARANGDFDSISEFFED